MKEVARLCRWVGATWSSPSPSLYGDGQRTGCSDGSWASGTPFLRTAFKCKDSMKTLKISYI